jgi:Flp pilus assembly pilin Flp
MKQKLYFSPISIFLSYYVSINTDNKGVVMGKLTLAKDNIKKLAKKFWSDESAQGMTEYVLLLVVIIALATIFKDQIKKAVNDKMNAVGSDIQGFSGN